LDAARTFLLNRFHETSYAEEGRKMKKLKVSATVSLLLGILFVFGLLCTHLALTDIWHGTEPNLEVEWNVVRISFLIETLFLISAFITLAQVFKFVKA